MGYLRDLHMNPDDSCITCNTQQLAYGNYKGCLCSIIADVGADEEARILKTLDRTNGYHKTVWVQGVGNEHSENTCMTCLNITLIKGEHEKLRRYI